MLRPERLAAAGLVLMLTVVVAAAGIRLGAGEWLRPVHRLAATLEVFVVAWLAWRLWRAPAALRRAAMLAVILTAALSLVGVLAGRQPPPAAAAANLLGGLALAALLAWIWGACRGGPASRLAFPAGCLVAAQLALGAWLAIAKRAGPALPAHGVLAMALAGLLCWFALARVRGRAGKALAALAIAAPLTGFSVLHFEHSALAPLAHATAAALLLGLLAHALGRGA